MALGSRFDDFKNGFESHTEAYHKSQRMLDKFLLMLTSASNPRSAENAEQFWCIHSNSYKVINRATMYGNIIILSISVFYWP